MSKIQRMYVYILKCKDNKYAVLTTDKVLDKPLEHFASYNPIEILGYFDKEIFVAGNIAADFVKKYGIDNVKVDKSLKIETKESFVINTKHDDVPVICITCSVCHENGHPEHLCPYKSGLKCANCPRSDHSTDDCPYSSLYQYWS